MPQASTSDKSRTVLVVHGRNLVAKESMFAFLRALDLRPLEWGSIMSATGHASPPIGEILKKGFELAQAAVVLSTPDDVAHLRGEYADGDDDATTSADQARPNVLFEAGMAMGWDEKRTVLVELGRVRGLSDLAGHHVLRMRETSEKRHELAERLRTAGLTLDTSGVGWLSAGDFTPPQSSTSAGHEVQSNAGSSSADASTASVTDGSLTMTPGRHKRGSFGGVEMSVRVANDAAGRHFSAIVVRATFIENGEQVGSAVGTIMDLGPGASKYTDLTGEDEINDGAQALLQVDSAF